MEDRQLEGAEGEAREEGERVSGLQQFFTIWPGVQLIICHAAHLKGDFHLLEERAAAAIQAVAARHPLFRARLLPLCCKTADDRGSNHSFPSILPLEKFDSSAVCKVLSPTGPEFWQEVLEEETNKAINRAEDPLFWVTVVLPYQKEKREDSEEREDKMTGEGKDEGHVLLFSDHAVSDGFSGYRILFDFFTALCSSSPMTALGPPLPLKPSLLSLLQKELKPMNDDEVLSPFLPHVHDPLFQLPAAPLQLDIPFPPVPYRTSAFATGTEDNFSLLVRRCKEERVTIHGALTACLLAAMLPYYEKAGRVIEDGDGREEVLDWEVDVDYNFRKRIPEESQRLGEDHVGLFVAIATSRFDRQSVREPFWDFARKAKRVADESLPQAVENLRLADVVGSHPQRAFELWKESPNCILSDVELSNIGKFPFPTEYALKEERSAEILAEMEERYEGKKLSLRSVHVYNSSNILSPQAVVFVSSVRQLCFSLCHKMEEGAAGRFFASFVSLSENCHSIGAEKTLKEVARDYFQDDREEA